MAAVAPTPGRQVFDHFLSSRFRQLYASQESSREGSSGTKTIISSVIIPCAIRPLSHSSSQRVASRAYHQSRGKERGARLTPLKISSFRLCRGDAGANSFLPRADRDSTAPTIAGQFRKFSPSSTRRPAAGRRLTMASGSNGESRSRPPTDLRA